MASLHSHWQLPPPWSIPDSFLQAVRHYTPQSSGIHAACLLWQRGIRNENQLRAFVDASAYAPTSPFAFGEEMERAVERLKQARQNQEKIAIWGDFDADGVTATAVLWEGLGQFFPQGDRLIYTIPNRLNESHGLSTGGLDRLAEEGVTLIVTCDTGSTNAAEITYAHHRGMEVIVTDHHTLPNSRPDAVALINPRSLERDHPLAYLSGVAVAYKLVEALYETFPNCADQPLEHLLDLVAIGLIADLVELKGDCRYLAQQGIARLQTQLKQPTRPGVAELLRLCRRSGDRPTDISFGIGPRINAISRIYGDAHFCVELLTSQNEDRCRTLAEATELANSRRKSLQRDIYNQAILRLAELDLSTTGVIVLLDPQWPVGVLGLVAGQIAQDYGRPTLLLTLQSGQDEQGQPLPLLAKGSARSVNQIDLYDLLSRQAHLLQGFGGHPYAAGLSLPADSVPLFTDAVNQDFRLRYGGAIAQTQALQVDRVVSVAELGPSLFREMSLLEPFGVGNPTPRLLVQNCWFTQTWHYKLRDAHNQQVNYIKTTFTLMDESSPDGFPGLWWGHYKDELPQGRCDVLLELDFNSAPGRGKSPRYEARLIAVRPHQVGVGSLTLPSAQTDRALGGELVDWRGPSGSNQSPLPAATGAGVLAVKDCPATWQRFFEAVRQARTEQLKLAIAYPPPLEETPERTWSRLVGMAKYLSRTGKAIPRDQLRESLGVGDRTLEAGLMAIAPLGFAIAKSGPILTISATESSSEAASGPSASHIQAFLQAVSEERFRQSYFHQASLDVFRLAASGNAALKPLAPDQELSNEF